MKAQPSRSWIMHTGWCVIGSLLQQLMFLCHSLVVKLEIGLCRSATRKVYWNSCISFGSRTIIVLLLKCGQVLVTELSTLAKRCVGFRRYYESLYQLFFSTAACIKISCSSRVSGISSFVILSVHGKTTAMEGFLSIRLQATA